MTQYIVTGMTCAACSSRVEKAVSKVPGVTSCSCLLYTSSGPVEDRAAPYSVAGLHDHHAPAHLSHEEADHGSAQGRGGGVPAA